MMKRLVFVFAFFVGFTGTEVIAGNPDSLVICNFFSEALTHPVAYHNLGFLCNNFQGRLCGTLQAEKAVAWVNRMLKEMDPDTVYMQPLTVKRWERGEKEVARVKSSVVGKQVLNICALGSSIGTGSKGIEAEVVEVAGFEQLDDLGREGVSGKIVFFNRCANPAWFYTFNAYAEVVALRARGALYAAKYGAIGVIVRSATLSHDDYPHTGIQHYADSVMRIPAVAVSTNGADSLSAWLKVDRRLRLFIRTTCMELPETGSFNVIAEIKGTVHPEKIIAFGGHIDAWDLGQGAHDDGAGVVQTMEVLRLFKQLQIKPANTLRLVVFMDEEYAQRGAAAYASAVGIKNELHIAAIESDRGGFTPQGFSIDATDKQVDLIRRWQPLLEPYGFWSFAKGGSGVDIGPLKKYGFPLIALVTDSQRYFDYQHAGSDTFDKISPRELQLGSAGIASLVYLIDKYSNLLAP